MTAGIEVAMLAPEFYSVSVIDFSQDPSVSDLEQAVVWSGLSQRVLLAGDKPLHAPESDGVYHHPSKITPQAV